MSYIPKPYYVESIKKLLPDIVLIRVKTKKIISEPGQFMQLSVLGTGECPISIASCDPNHMEFLVRGVGNVTKQLCKIKKGNKLFMRGPYGLGFPMSFFVKKDLFLIAGGTGIASIRSVLKYIEKNREKYNNIYVFIGFKSPKEVMFQKDIETWSKRFNVFLTADSADNSWHHEVGLIPEIIKKHNIQSENKEALMCGPPIMMTKCIEQLSKQGFHDENIWLSLERRMECGLGRCGRCMVHDKHTCIDGPIFRYNKIKDFKND